MIESLEKLNFYSESLSKFSKKFVFKKNFLFYDYFLILDFILICFNLGD